MDTGPKHSAELKEDLEGAQNMGPHSEHRGERERQGARRPGVLPLLGSRVRA